jgi:hypothetical protein
LWRLVSCLNQALFFVHFTFFLISSAASFALLPRSVALPPGPPWERCQPHCRVAVVFHRTAPLQPHHIGPCNIPPTHHALHAQLDCAGPRLFLPPACDCPAAYHLAPLRASHVSDWTLMSAAAASTAAAEARLKPHQPGCMQAAASTTAAGRGELGCLKRGRRWRRQVWRRWRPACTLTLSRALDSIKIVRLLKEKRMERFAVWKTTSDSRHMQPAGAPSWPAAVRQGTVAK